MKYKEALVYLEEVKTYGSILGLTSMKELMSRLDNPQDKYQVIHLAGTNGKGSTQAFLTSIFMQTKSVIGHYTSPVVFEPMEAIQVNQKMIAKRTYAKYVTLIRDIALQMVADGYSHPTIFEINTAIAFLYFYDKKSKTVILETGLGGREDATNVVTNPKVCVFTSISMDHMDYLGNTIEKIAYEKAGIITEKSLVIIGKNDANVQAVLMEEAKKKQAKISQVKANEIEVIKEKISEQVFSYGDYKNIKIKMAGSYQIDNAVLAVESILAYNSSEFDDKKITVEQIMKGLYETEWLGRFSVIGEKPLFIVDGAHNEKAAKRLQESVDLYFTNKKIIYIIGVLKDKEYEKIIELTAPHATHVITVTSPGNERALPAYDLAKKVQVYNPLVTASDSIEESVEMAYLLADKDTVIIAFGSLSYLGHISELVKNRKFMKADMHQNL